MDPQTTPTPGSNNINLHPHKLYSLVGAGLGLLGLILPWAKQNLGGFGGGISSNGFQGWGILSLLGVVAVLIASLLNDKTKDFDANMKLMAIGGFGALVLGAFISFMQVSGNANPLGGVKTGIGVWICIIAGVLGILFLSGVMKVPPPRTPGAPPPTPPLP